jgi:hypothetical protein
MAEYPSIPGIPPEPCIVCEPYLCQFPPAADHRRGDRWVCPVCRSVYRLTRRYPSRPWRLWSAPHGHWRLVGPARPLTLADGWRRCQLDRKPEGQENADTEPGMPKASDTEPDATQAAQAEIKNLRDEIERLRPVVKAAIEWREGQYAKKHWTELGHLEGQLGIEVGIYVGDQESPPRWTEARLQAVLPPCPIRDTCRADAQRYGRCYCGKLSADGSVLRPGETAP